MCIHKININEKCILVNSQYFGDAGEICRSRRFMQTDEIIICDWLVQIMHPNLEAISDGDIVLIGLVHRLQAKLPLCELPNMNADSSFCSVG